MVLIQLTRQKDLPFTFSVSSKLCLKSNDLVISKSIEQTGTWEEDQVTNVMKAMEIYGDAVFIGRRYLAWHGDYHQYVTMCPDGGCNIGVFTVMVAAMRRRVVAVDILQENIDFVKTSLSLMDSLGLVEFVLNAISDQHETLYPVLELEGNGGSSKGRCH